MRRNAAKSALQQADTDHRLRRALLRRYAGANIRLAVGQTCFYWRDAQQADLVKIRWRGPAKVLMVEDDEQGNASTYWICHKTQLLRCAPHHCRPDFRQITNNVVDNLLEAKEVLGQVKSRGVTRFLDLNRLNRQHIDDINEDEEMISDHEADDYVPEAKRRRLAELQDGAEGDDDYEPSIADDNPHDDGQPPDDGHHPSPGLMGLPEESPSSPGLLGQHDGLSPSPGLMGPPDAPPAPMADEPPLPPTLPITNNDEVEPSAAVFPPTPAAGQVMDPATAERFQVPLQETFEQRRARVDGQETLSFGPRRSQLQSSHGATPYDRPARGDDDAANMAFNVEDMEQDSLPGDWCFKPETGYFELREGARVRDFWELKAGCLLRHLCHQRRTLFDPAGSSDIPVPLDKLGNVRVTIHFDRDGSAKTFTDDFRNPQHHDKDLRQHQLPSTWKGISVFQINAETRKELNMFSSDSNHCYHVQNAKKVAQGLKNQHQRQQRPRTKAKWWKST